ncbi:glycosyltransferase family 2 protein [Thalassovita taeanensis]|nr:glycosyltransferase family 2 protein [Thalassovita taeanensis]
MRNEGIFVLEWLAYHMGLGFDAIVIVTNDCTDGSDLLLDRLAERGLITHIRQTVPPGTAPQDSGMDLALAWARQAGMVWALHIDSDEFLLIDAEDPQSHRRITDVIPTLYRADVVPLAWRAFGDSGVTEWQPGAAALERNTHAEPGAEPGVTKFKCLFRVASFARATDHNPLDPLVESPVVLSADGEALSNQSLYQAKSARFRPADIACRARTARLNHYAVRSEDVFLMKNDRGDGQGKQAQTKYHLGSNWHLSCNRNDIEDRAILRHWPATAEKLADLRADPATTAAERSCQEWFTTRRAQVLTPEMRRQWTRRERINS